MRSKYIILLLILLAVSCSKEVIVVVPDSGYDWPEPNRPYWPTDGWQSATMVEHKIDESKMAEATNFATADDLMRALLVVKDGYLVVEEYYHEGGPEKSTNLWSCTKSVTSTLVGFLYDDMDFHSTDQLMSDLMPAYPEFGDITLHHTLTMTTGLNWHEEGPLWVQWALSED